MKIVMIGAGYVGLVSGVCFSDFGHEVICVDKDPAKIRSLTRGEIPIYEPGLQALMSKNIKASRLHFSSDLKAAIADAKVVFIAVGTPARRGDGHADLTYVMEAAKEIAQLASDGIIVVIKSTVPVGTNRRVKHTISQTNSSLEFEVVSNPEFLREGSAIKDFMNPDRVVVGVQSIRAENVIREIYRPLYLREFPLLVADSESAEMIKYASNAFLATKVTFINEIASLCEKVGADVKLVARGMGLDGRIGNKFLHAGPGYGGSCFPKDTNALVRMASENSSPMKIVEAVITVNEEIKRKLIEKLLQMCGGTFANKSIAILGVTFKPDTDDMREAPSLMIVSALLEEGASVRVRDPKGRQEGEVLLPGVKWCEDAYEAASGADLIVILTEWNEFRAMDLFKLASVMRVPKLVDYRNVYSYGEAMDAGFVAYRGFGRKFSE